MTDLLRSPLAPLEGNSLRKLSQVHQSGKKMRAVDIIEKAMRLESEGDVDGALRLLDSVVDLLPNQPRIMAKIEQLRTVVDKQKILPNTVTHCETAPAKNLNERFRAIASSADILNTAAKKIAPLPPPVSIAPTEIAFHEDESIADEAEESFVSVEEEDGEASLAQEMSRMELVDKLKDNLFAALEYRLIDTLNNGSIEELLCLKGIGKVRAERILELRDTHFEFGAASDLTSIGMSARDADGFLQKNAGVLIGIETKVRSRKGFQ